MGVIITAAVAVILILGGLWLIGMAALVAAGNTMLD